MLLEDLGKDFFDFIEKNKDSDPSGLRLKLHDKLTEINADLAITQIECRKKCKRKLQRFLRNQKFIFPSTVSAEQSSHQAVAAYHDRLIGKEGKILDMTAGLGIDAMTFAMNGKTVEAIELDPLKCKVLRHNAEILGLRNIEIKEGDSSAIITEAHSNYDVIFIDPARRGENNARVYDFKDSRPNIMTVQNSVIGKCGKLMIKASPLLDVRKTIDDINNVTSVHAVSVEGECKEILVIAESGQHTLEYHAVNLDCNGDEISHIIFTDTDTSEPISYVSDVKEGNYLYEPDASVMKLKAWQPLINKHPGLKKLSHDSHLFVSENLSSDFPGRTMRIEKIIDKKSRKLLKGQPVSIVARNYPVRANELRKILGVREGEHKFLYATRVGPNPIMLLCEKITAE